MTIIGKKQVTIKVSSEEQKIKIATSIHEQLVGNQDYIDSNIMLNIDEPLTVELYIFDECVDAPKITI